MPVLRNPSQHLDQRPRLRLHYVRAQTLSAVPYPTIPLGRPRVRDDNPVSEAHFKAIKYHPGLTGRFPDIHAAIDLCRSFFPWYNSEHPHGGIAMLTPADVHHGRADRVVVQRNRCIKRSKIQQYLT